MLKPNGNSLKNQILGNRGLERNGNTFFCVVTILMPQHNNDRYAIKGGSIPTPLPLTINISDVS